MIRENDAMSRIEPDLYSHNHDIDEKLLKERRVQWCRQCGAIYGPNGFERPKLHRRLSDAWSSEEEPRTNDVLTSKRNLNEKWASNDEHQQRAWALLKVLVERDTVDAVNILADVFRQVVPLTNDLRPSQRDQYKTCPDCGASCDCIRARTNDALPVDRSRLQRELEAESMPLDEGQVDWFEVAGERGAKVANLRAWMCTVIEDAETLDEAKAWARRALDKEDCPDNPRTETQMTEKESADKPGDFLRKAIDNMTPEQLASFVEGGNKTPNNVIASTRVISKPGDAIYAEEYTLTPEAQAALNIGNAHLPSPRPSEAPTVEQVRKLAESCTEWVCPACAWPTDAQSEMQRIREERDHLLAENRELAATIAQLRTPRTNEARPSSDHALSLLSRDLVKWLGCLSYASTCDPNQADVCERVVEAEEALHAYLELRYPRTETPENEERHGTMRYRKRPVEVEAFAANSAWAAINDKELHFLPEWLRVAYCNGEVDALPDYSVRINTLEGVMKALPTDMIIQGVKGEIYPCKRDIFEATYEIVPKDESGDGTYLEMVR